MLAAIAAVVTFLIYMITSVQAFLGNRRLARLHCIEPLEHGPTITAVIPACNEERHIEAALQSVLSQDYEGLQVIAVNDRSTDRTGPILDAMAARTPSLRVVHIDSLPEGWLGKNHALHHAASMTAGEWLLFADADVVMDRTALSRAIRHATECGFDHVAVAPRAVVGGFWAKAFLTGFAVIFGMYTKPWRARDPRAREYIGIGAFNLVRRSTYQAIGGHTTIAMRPDDDLKLGKVIKSAGFRQDAVLGTELLIVEWYASFAEMRSGLMKNLFAVLEYNVLRATLGCAGLFFLMVWPWIAVLVTSGTTRWLNAAAVASALISFALNAGVAGLPRRWGFAIPLAGLITIYLIARSAALAIRNGGIDWRGTHYSLQRLRANRV